MYYWDTDSYNICGTPMSFRDEQWDMACTLACLTLLLTGADACTPYIIDSVWGKDEAACLALGGPRGNLSLICWKILTLSKVAMNMVHIWMTDPAIFLVPTSPSFQQLPPTVQQLLLQASNNRVYACKPVPPGTWHIYDPTSHQQSLQVHYS